MVEVEQSPHGEVGARRERASVMPLVGDAAAVCALTELMLKRSGISMNELARRLGRTVGSVNQYRSGRRGRGMTVSSLVRWASACGCQIVVELPE